MTATISYAEACRDPNLFGPWFAGESWAAWRVVDKALFGEALTDAELVIFRELTGREEAPTEPVTEAWFIVGRRGGKDVKAASIAAYLATIGAELYGYLDRLARGERGVVQLLAVDRSQARVALGYLKAFFQQPLLASLVAKETADGLELQNNLSIEVTTNDRRRVRGRTVVAAIFDEVAHWLAEHSTTPDEEVYRAVKPAMATVAGAMLIGISSPYARKGLLFKKWRSHFAKPSDVLVIQAPTWIMNPNLPRDGTFLRQAFEDDPASAAAEFGAQFRQDIDDFVSREVVEACITPGCYERPRVQGIAYKAFVDPSGGSRDSMTLAISHREDERAVLDATREVRAPFSPEATVADFCKLLKAYGIMTVSGDRYAGEWPREQFRKYGIAYRLAEQPRSDLYRDMLPLLNSGTVDLLDDERLVSQIVGLERRTTRAGKDSIDHAPGGHDDLANAVAGAVALCSARHDRPVALFSTYCSRPDRVIVSETLPPPVIYAANGEPKGRATSVSSSPIAVFGRFFVNE